MKVAVSAARAIGGALVGVDLMLDEGGRWTVIEVNGAVEFADDYLPGGDVFAEALAAVERAVFEKGGRRPVPERL